MNTYPSIPASSGTKFTNIPNAYIFDKLDGSNLRFEWSKKAGWYKFGTRRRLFDETDEIFGEALPVFFENLAKPLHDYAKKNRYEKITVFAEFWGENSFAGVHVPGEPKRLTLFDVTVYRKGFIPPQTFVKEFKNLDSARLLEVANWTRGYVQKVREGLIEGVTFEGVVAKSGGGLKCLRAKAKTQEWINAVKNRFDEKTAESLLNS